VFDGRVTKVSQDPVALKVGSIVGVTRLPGTYCIIEAEPEKRHAVVESTYNTAFKYRVLPTEIVNVEDQSQNQSESQEA